MSQENKEVNNSTRLSHFQVVEDRRHEERLSKCTSLNELCAEKIRHIIRNTMIENGDEKSLKINLDLYYKHDTGLSL